MQEFQIKAWLYRGEGGLWKGEYNKGAGNSHSSELELGLSTFFCTFLERVFGMMWRKKSFPVNALFAPRGLMRGGGRRKGGETSDIPSPNKRGGLLARAP